MIGFSIISCWLLSGACGLAFKKKMGVPFWLTFSGFIPAFVYFFLGILAFERGQVFVGYFGVGTLLLSVAPAWGVFHWAHQQNKK